MRNTTFFSVYQLIHIQFLKGHHYSTKKTQIICYRIPYKWRCRGLVIHRTECASHGSQFESRRGTKCQLAKHNSTFYHTRQTWTI